MRVSSNDAEKLAKFPPAEWVGVLFFGANAGLVKERADICVKSIVADIRDAFRICELTGDAIKRDPARLTDELGAISMFGGRRVVRIRDTSEGLTAILEELLAAKASDTLVVIEASELSKTSHLRKLFESAKNAGAIECFDDRPEDAARLIRDSLRPLGWSIAQDALAYLSEALSADRQLLRAEMEKLSCFLGTAPEGSEVSKSEVVNLIGESGSIEAEEIADAVAEGNLKALDRYIIRGQESGIAWGVVLGFALRLLQRLLSVAEAGGPMWGKMPSQLAGWDRGGLIRALSILSAAEARTRMTGFPESTIAQQALLQAAGLRKQKS